MSENEDNLPWWAACYEGVRRCTGTTVSGRRCEAVCRRLPRREAVWPGVHDRCCVHVDPLALRTYNLARIAQKTGADRIESLRPLERALELEE